MRYPAMTAIEKDSLIRLILHEEGCRAVWSLEERELPKYDLEVRLCEAIEQSEAGICQESKLFQPPGCMSRIGLQRGYEGCQGYVRLREVTPSYEAQYEMQTILREHPDQVTQATQALLGEFLDPTPDFLQDDQISEQVSQQTQNIVESQGETLVLGQGEAMESQLAEPESQMD